MLQYSWQNMERDEVRTGTTCLQDPAQWDPGESKHTTLLLKGPPLLSCVSSLSFPHILHWEHLTWQFSIRNTTKCETAPLPAGCGGYTRDQAQDSNTRRSNTTNKRVLSVLKCFRGISELGFFKSWAAWSVASMQTFTKQNTHLQDPEYFWSYTVQTKGPPRLPSAWLLIFMLPNEILPLCIYGLK